MISEHFHFTKNKLTSLKSSVWHKTLFSNNMITYNVYIKYNVL